MSDYRLDDLPEVVTRAECAITLTFDGARHDLELMHVLNETINYDKTSIAAYLDRAEEIASLVSTLRVDMETHMKATAREWLDDDE